MPNQTADSRVADQNHRGEILRNLNIADDSVTPVHDAPEGTEPVHNHQGEQRTRPRRERRIPAKFKDFVMN